MSEEKTPPLATLLTRPAELAGLLGHGRAAATFLAALVAGAALYGAGAGFFDGGAQVALAALKLPLILAGALALCLPSFVVFHLLAGVALPTGRLAGTVLGLGALAGLLAAALAPVGWLFSVSSRSGAFVAFVHAAVWTVVVLLGLRFLRRALGRDRQAAATVLWAALVWLVALQLASTLAPVVHRWDDEPAWSTRRGFFLAQWIDDADREARTPRSVPARAPAAGTGSDARPGVP